MSPLKNAEDGPCGNQMGAKFGQVRLAFCLAQQSCYLAVGRFSTAVATLASLAEQALNTDAACPWICRMGQ